MYTSVLSFLLREVHKLALCIPESHIHTEVVCMFIYYFVPLTPESSSPTSWHINLGIQYFIF